VVQLIGKRLNAGDQLTTAQSGVPPLIPDLSITRNANIISLGNN